MSRFGPTRTELVFRLVVGVVGLIGLFGLTLWRGPFTGPAFFEINLIGGGFFGATALWAARKLVRKDHP